MKTLTQDRDNIQLLYEQVSDAFFRLLGLKVRTYKWSHVRGHDPTSAQVAIGLNCFVPN